MRLTTWASCQSNIQLVCLNCGFAGAFPVTHYIGQFGLVSSLILVLTPQSRCSVWPLNITFAYILFSMVLVWLLHSLWVLANPDFLTSKMALSDQKPFWACLAYSFNVKFSQHLQDRKKTLPDMSFGPSDYCWYLFVQKIMTNKLLCSVRNKGFPVVRANQIFCRTTTISQAVVRRTTSSLKSIACNKKHIS